ncbi:unnamed protein product [Polarella glacialis]|uniref:Uncharacterized protein n=1 Tax=Polarella glacialis TaxID=89957 RepID=A0A813KSZ5_POLGL|nr:unnamed protein product [Polarella glacialis]
MAFADLVPVPPQGRPLRVDPSRRQRPFTHWQRQYETVRPVIEIARRGLPEALGGAPPSWPLLLELAHEEPPPPVSEEPPDNEAVLLAEVAELRRELAEVELKAESERRSRLSAVARLRAEQEAKRRHAPARLDEAKRRGEGIRSAEEAAEDAISAAAAIYAACEPLEEKATALRKALAAEEAEVRKLALHREQLQRQGVFEEEQCSELQLRVDTLLSKTAEVQEAIEFAALPASFHMWAPLVKDLLFKSCMDDMLKAAEAEFGAVAIAAE